MSQTCPDFVLCGCSGNVWHSFSDHRAEIHLSQPGGQILRFLRKVTQPTGCTKPDKANKDFLTKLQVKNKNWDVLQKTFD